MCTALSLKTKDTYFGRNLDYDFSYGEEVTIVPKDHPLTFRNGEHLKQHFAIMGIAHVDNNYPLYYDAINEMGLGMAGLNFVGNASYHKKSKTKTNIASFELIPYILAKAKNVKEAVALLKEIEITDEPYSQRFPPSALHWLISDKEESIVLEVQEDGTHIYPNPYGVLTNNPPFPEQVSSLNIYQGLSSKDRDDTLTKGLENKKFYSRGLGTLGLPGDLTSSSRFVRAVFGRFHSVSPTDELSSIHQYFHIMGSVEQVRGLCEVKENEYEYTIYTSCYNLSKGLCYLKTYYGDIEKPISFDSKEHWLKD